MKYIYAIRCIPTDKIYIGCTYNVNKRLSEHMNELNRNNHYNKELQEDFNHYSKSDFTHEILECVSDEDSLLREDYWINYYGGINSTYVYNNMTNKTKSESTKHLISSFYKGKSHIQTYGEEKAAKMREANRLKHLGKYPAFVPHKGKVKTLSGDMLLVTYDLYLKIKSLRADGHTYGEISSLTGVGENGVRNIVKDDIQFSWKCND